MLARPLAGKCSRPFVPGGYHPVTGEPLQLARAKCRTSDITLAEFGTLAGKRDGANPGATTVEDSLAGRRTCAPSCTARAVPMLTHAESITPIRSLGARCVPEFKASSGLRLSAAPAMGSVTAANGIMHSNRSTNTALRMSRRRGCGRSRSVATTSCAGSSTNRRSGGRRCCSTMPTMPENGPMPPSVRRLLPAPRAFRAARDRWQLVLPDSRRRHRQRRRHVRRPGCLGP